MTKEELINLKEKLSKLSEVEEKQRNLHLRKVARGEVDEKPVGYPSIDKPWLQFYPEEAITEDLPKMKAYDYIYERNKKYTNQVALSYFGKKISYDELFNKIDMVAKAFKAKGISSGDVVTMAMATTPEMLYIFYALNKIGAVVNIIDPRLTADEIQEKIDLSSSKTLIGLEMTVDNVLSGNKEKAFENIIVVSPFESAPLPLRIIGKAKEKKYSNKRIHDWDSFISAGKEYKGPIDSEYVEGKPAFIIYTGGTTGSPKGVVLTNDNLNAMAIMQVVSGYNLERKDTFLNFLPPFSAYSVVNASHIPLSLGFTITLVPLFEPKDFPKLMRKYKPNHVMSGPILWDIMMNDKKSQFTDLSNLKSPISGGDSLPIEMEKAINDYLKKRGCKYKLQQGYGMTEVSAAACYSTEDSYSLGSVGIPLVKNNILIRDLETKEELKTNQDGEVLICTPTMMLGYLNNEQATSEIITEENGKRWISTGDIGHIDENGHLFLVGRIKRMIVRSGNKLFPSHVENLIMTIPGIEHCSIVAMPDKDEKSAPIAHIVLSSELQGQEERIIKSIEELVAANMPEFNIPKKYVFRENIPLTEMSKVDFKLLELESVDYAQQEQKIIFINSDTPKELKK